MLAPFPALNVGAAVATTAAEVVPMETTAAAALKWLWWHQQGQCDGDACGSASGGHTMARPQ